MTSAKTTDGTGFKQDVHRVGQGVQALRADVNGVAHAVADAARSGGAELRQGVQHAVEAAKEKLEGVTDAAREKIHDAKEAASEAAHSLQGLIARHPLASIGIAAGVGVLIGRFVFRHRS